MEARSGVLWPQHLSRGHQNQSFGHIAADEVPDGRLGQGSVAARATGGIRRNRADSVHIHIFGEMESPGKAAQPRSRLIENVIEDEQNGSLRIFRRQGQEVIDSAKKGAG
jgi:hypothetical protein